MTEQLNQLLNEVGTISTSYKRVDKATGGGFNIFSVLKIETDEVTTHSRFIAELLNPKGQHNQGDTFLQKFIQQIYNEEHPVYLQIDDLSNIKVEIEHYIGTVTDKEGGRLDIVLFQGKSAKILIENKIYATEQANQLQRYKKNIQMLIYFF